MKNSLVNLCEPGPDSSIQQVSASRKRRGRDGRYFAIAILASLLTAYCLAATTACAASAPTSAKEEVARLTLVLQSKADQKEKADACRELARIGTPEAVPVLATLLSDERLSHMARYGLETIPDPSVDKALRAALGQLHGRPLVGVIGSIGVRRDPKAVAQLAKLLRDPDPEVAQAAARALGNIPNASSLKALQQALVGASAANQLAICEGLLRYAERVSTRDRQKGMAIYDKLRSLPLPQQDRTAALRGAILCREKAGLPLLLEELRSDDFARFAAATRISQEVAGVETTRALAEEISKLAPDKQIVLIQALGVRADSAALPALFSAAKTGAKPVRLAAVHALAQFGNPTAVPVLMELLMEDREIAQAAQESLSSLPGGEADAAALTLLRSSEESRRNTGLEMIVRRRMVSAIPELLRAAEGPDPRFRVLATKKLGELAGPNETKGLLGLLAKAKSPEDLEAAEQALAIVTVKATNGDVTADEVASAFDQAQPAQKCALLRVLSAMGGTAALKHVRAAVHDPAPEVRASAIRALGSWNSADAAPDLLELARNASDPAEKLLSLRSYLGLAAQSELAADQRAAMCREAAALVQKEDEKKLLLAALANLYSTDSLALIQNCLADVSVKEEAATACVSVVEKLLQEKDAAKQAAQMIEPLQKVTRLTANPELAKRAQGLLEQAQKKAMAN